MLCLRARYGTMIFCNSYGPDSRSRAAGQARLRGSQEEAGGYFGSVPSALSHLSGRELLRGSKMQFLLGGISYIYIYTYIYIYVVYANI